MTTKDVLTQLRNVTKLSDFKKINISVADDATVVSRWWDDNMITKTSRYTWEFAAEVPLTLLCTRWLTELTTGKVTTNFPVLTAYLALHLRNPEKITEYLFDQQGATLELEMFQRFADSSNFNQEGIHMNEEEYRSPDEIRKDGKTDLSHVGFPSADVMRIFVPFLALVSMRSSIKKITTVAKALSDKALNMFNTIYPHVRTGAINIPAKPESMDAFRVHLKTCSVLFNSVLIPVLVTRASAIQNNIGSIQSLLNFCIVTHSQFVGLALVKLTFEVAHRLDMTTMEVLSLLWFKNTRASIIRVAEYIARYMATESTAVHYRWARVISSDFFLNLQPRLNATLYVLLANLASSPPYESGPVVMDAYTMARDKAVNNAEVIARDIADAIAWSVMIDEDTSPEIAAAMKKTKDRPVLVEDEDNPFAS